MGKKALLLVGGIALGVLVLFAFVGFQSTFKSNTPSNATNTASDTTPPATTSQTTDPSSGGIKGLVPIPKGENNENAVSTLDTPNQDAEDTAIELINEPPMPGEIAPNNSNANNTLTPPNTNQQSNTNTPAPTPDNTANTNQQPSQQPTPATPTDTASTPPASNTDNTARTSLEQAPVQTREPGVQPDAGKGTLEVQIQAAETGKALKANVYVQRTNGVNVEQAKYTNKARFSLSPGTYRITARANGRASVVRKIHVPKGAVVNEIFPLPQAQANTAPQAATPSNPPAPSPATPPPSKQPQGRLRVAALSAEDGNPITVNFIIKDRSGKVLKQVNSVALTEVSLPAQAITVTFDYNGFQGSHDLDLRADATTTHTFNLRGIPSNNTAGQNPAPPAETMPPPSEQNPAPPLNNQPNQPQNVEEILLQRFQEELMKHMR